MKRFLLCYLLGFNLQVQAETFTEVEVLGVEYPPFITQTQTTGGQVFEVLAQKLADTGVKVIPKIVPPGRAGRNVTQGQWQATLIHPEAWLISTSRIKQVVLEDQTFQLVFFRKRQETPFTWQKLSDLAGQTVSIFRSGTRTNSRLQQAMIEAGLQPVRVNDNAQAFRMMQAGRVDIVIAVIENGFYEIKAIGGNPDNFQFATPPLHEYQLSVWVNAHDPGGLALYDALMQEPAQR